MQKKKEKRNYHSWSEDEVQFLKENFGKMSISELANLIGTTEKSVKRKIEYAKLKNTRSYINKLNSLAERWTPEEVNYLKEHYGKESFKEIASNIGKSTGSVSGKVWYLKKQGNLKPTQLTLNLTEEKKMPRTKWTKTEIKYLKNNINSKTIQEISAYLGRGESSVKSKLNRLKIRKAFPFRNKNTEPIQQNEKNKQKFTANIKIIVLVLSLLFNFVVLSAFLYYIFHT